MIGGWYVPCPIRGSFWRGMSPGRGRRIERGRSRGGLSEDYTFPIFFVSGSLYNNNLSSSLSDALLVLGGLSKISEEKGRNLGTGDGEEDPSEVWNAIIGLWLPEPLLSAIIHE